jgi:two-component system response regulator PilR (NtrC family)
MESEFFGHKKGSFTVAVEDKEGLFQAAHHGTLFLDEVADLPLNMQVKLLRAIQEKAVKAVGGVEEISVDTLILSATHKNLEEEVEKGRFRQDLYYRLNVIKLSVPTLHERGDDIFLLADHFLESIAERWQLPIMELSKASVDVLSRYPFPGNVRELENILERACTLADGDIIEPEDLQLPTNTPVINTSSYDTIFKQEESLQQSPQHNDNNHHSLLNKDPALDEREEIIHALNETRWNRTAAAKVLGMTFRQLRYRIKKYELDQNH